MVTKTNVIIISHERYLTTRIWPPRQSCQGLCQSLAMSELWEDQPNRRHSLHGVEEHPNHRDSQSGWGWLPVSRVQPRRCHVRTSSPTQRRSVGANYKRRRSKESIKRECEPVKRRVKGKGKGRRAYEKLAHIDVGFPNGDIGNGTKGQNSLLHILKVAICIHSVVNIIHSLYTWKRLNTQSRRRMLPWGPMLEFVQEDLDDDPLCDLLHSSCCIWLSLQKEKVNRVKDKIKGVLPTFSWSSGDDSAKFEDLLCDLNSNGTCASSSCNDQDRFVLVGIIMFI